MDGKNDSVRQLESTFGPLEIRVLNALWARHTPACVRDLQPQFPAVAYTTLMTTLDRLFRKGTLSREKNGRAFYYRPKASQQELISELAGSTFATLLPGDTASVRPILSMFVDTCQRPRPRAARRAREAGTGAARGVEAQGAEVTRAALIVTVAFAAYGAISSVLALLVGVAWRAGYLTRNQADPASRANWLVALRITPSVLGFLLSVGVVLPVYLAFEPIRDYEPVGPIPIVLAAIGLLVVFAASCVAARAAFLTRRIRRQWLQSATALDICPAADVPAYVVDTPSPMVALVGVFSPRLVAARTVIDVCSAEELAAIVAHERGHLHAHDNFKRWLLTCAPDVMRWTRAHESIVAAWRDAAEYAADDAATRGQEEARVDLAALLLKIARLAPRLRDAGRRQHVRGQGRPRSPRPQAAHAGPGATHGLVAAACPGRARHDPARHRRRRHQPRSPQGNLRNRRAERRIRPLDATYDGW